MTRTNTADLARLCWRRVDDAAAVVRDFDAVVEITFDRSKFPAARDFAYCVDGAPPRVVLSDKLAEEPPDVQDAVVRHELGHAVDFLLGTRKCNAALRVLGVNTRGLGPERRADEVARMVWGQTIRYDLRDVQTLGPGVYPRPTRLGR